MNIQTCIALTSVHILYTCIVFTPSSSARRILATDDFLKQSKRIISPLDEPVSRSHPIGAKQHVVTLHMEDMYVYTKLSYTQYGHTNLKQHNEDIYVYV